ncbi:hypothetical protein F5X68DRAFT_16531 [Plectosphaerella plurivora]|uniref:Secreted protein n=1 Tax=Plectosphaerella plurivora TaxID=936078 RepID=A0A9P8V824_9PEZI|nr:hypothetical protein F5X68DRAFT_16531 [Plectosphaerella plurivora]
MTIRPWAFSSRLLDLFASPSLVLALSHAGMAETQHRVSEKHRSRTSGGCRAGDRRTSSGPTDCVASRESASSDGGCCCRGQLRKKGGENANDDGSQCCLLARSPSTRPQAWLNAIADGHLIRSGSFSLLQHVNMVNLRCWAGRQCVAWRNTLPQPPRWMDG